MISPSRAAIPAGDGEAPSPPVWDVVIVGAGPAGLFAALTILAGSNKRILIIDRGKGIEGRKRDYKVKDQASSLGTDLESGVGGAGLFSDGKLCLSLEVGGHLEDSLKANERSAILRDIRGVFELLTGESAPSGTVNITEALRAADQAGLVFKHYPVLHVGTERCAILIRDIRDLLLQGGAVFRTGWEVQSIGVDSRTGDKELFVRSSAGMETVVRGRSIVLAMGKVGASLQSALCENLGIEAKATRLYAGVRLETDAEVLEPLFHRTRDPKYALEFEDGSKIKTHCASRNGEVLELKYEGQPLAGGHNFRTRRSGRSGFALLWNGMGQSGDPYSAAISMMRRIGRTTGGHLLVQSVEDYALGRRSDTSIRERIRLSSVTAVPGDVRQALPSDYWWRCDDFLKRLETLCPGLLGSEAVFYAPAIEWWMKQIAIVDEYMQTSVPGVFVCGDGSGWSQGIVHAAATGILAGRGISAKYPSLAEWMQDAVRSHGPLKRRHVVG